MTGREQRIDTLVIRSCRQSPIPWRGIRTAPTAAWLLAAAIVLSACSTDVVATWAVRSFESLLATANTAGLTGSSPDNRWLLASPDGEQFLWSRDFSQPSIPDAALSLNAAPFLAAGLHPEKLPDGPYRYDADQDRLIIQAELSAAPFDAALAATPLGAFREMLRTSRSAIGYHEELDHYGISLGGGNMIEWAKDATRNDKDLVFVLAPEPLQEAGLRVDSLEGWTLAAVIAMNDQGKPKEVMKLLKPFDLVP